MARQPEKNFLKENLDKNRKTIQENIAKEASKKIEVKDPMDEHDYLLDDEPAPKGKATLDESGARYGKKKSAGY